MIRLVRSTLLALMVGGTGSLLFVLLGLPLPWMLGSLTATAIVATLGRNWFVPLPIRDAARPVIGVMAGSAFTPAIVQVLPLWWPALLVVLGFTLVSVMAGFLFFVRVAGFDKVTAFFASAPGGLAELTTLGGSYGGNLREMVLVHSIRIICVLAILPILLQFLAGYDLSAAVFIPQADHAGSEGLTDWAILIGCGVLGYAIGKRVRVPGGVLIPALFLSAVAHGAGWTDAAPPGWLVAAVQVVIGSAAGARFFGIKRSEALGAMLWGLVWAALLLSLSAIVATLGPPLLGQPTGALLLAFAPGGTAEMTILSIAIGIEVAFVITCQVSRMMMVYATAPLLFAFFRWRGVIEPPQDAGRPR